MKKNENTNSPIIFGSNNKFEKETVIGHGSKIVKKEIHIDDGVKKYEVASPDTGFIESIAKILINKFGVQKTVILDLISLLGTLLGIPIGFNSFMPPTPNNEFLKSSWVGMLPKFPQFATVIFIIGILFFVSFILISDSLMYYRSSKCEECNRDFAKQEYKPRKRRDVEAVDSIERMEKRFYQCRYCGAKTTHKKFLIIPKNENEDES